MSREIYLAAQALRAAAYTADALTLDVEVDQRLLIEGLAHVLCDEMGVTDAQLHSAISLLRRVAMTARLERADSSSA